jgi:hypothetical protein
MASSLSLLTRSHNNLLLNLTRCDRYFLFQPKRSTINRNSLIKVIAHFHFASCRTLNLYPSKGIVTMNTSFVRRQATSTANPVENLPKKVRTKPKKSSVDSMSPEAKRAYEIMGYTTIASTLGLVIYSGELYIILFYKFFRVFLTHNYKESHKSLLIVR